MKWYYAVAPGVSGTQQADLQQAGPVDDAEFERLIQTGAIGRDTLVWREGMTSWQSLSEANSFRTPMDTPAHLSDNDETVYLNNPTAAQNVQQYAASVPAQTSQPYAAPSAQPDYPNQPNYPSQPTYPNQPAYQAAPLAGVRFAGFWIRFVARVIDFIILGILHLLIRIPFGLLFGLSRGFGGPFGVPFGVGRGVFNPGLFGSGFLGLFGLTGLLSLAVSVAYEVYFVSARGATPGKMVLGLKIIQFDGSPIPPGLALGRYVASFISAFFFFIGYIMAAFDGQKRALHDMICNTRVIHVR